MHEFHYDIYLYIYDYDHAVLEMGRKQGNCMLIKHHLIPSWPQETGFTGIDNLSTVFNVVLTF